MPKSGEVRINGAQIFGHNEKTPEILKRQPPVIYQPREVGAVRQAVTKPTQKHKTKPGRKHLGQANKFGTKQGVKPGRTVAPTVAGQGTSQERAKLAKYWATHPAQYQQWARENHKDYTDCGVFIGKVMRDSGSDAHYPTSWTGAQWDYVHDPKNGWTIGKVGEDGGPQPGDVLLHQPYTRASGRFIGHTGLYYGLDPKKAGHVVTDEASLGTHGPDPRSGYTASGLAHTYQIWARPPSEK